MEIIAALAWVSGVSLVVEFSLWVFIGFCGIIDAIGNAMGVPIDGATVLTKPLNPNTTKPLSPTVAGVIVLTTWIAIVWLFFYLGC